MDKDIAFEMAASHVRFGVGVTREVGMDLKEIGARRVLVVTDPLVGKLPPVRTVLESLDRSGVPFDLFDRVRVEPSDESLLEAIAVARAGVLRRVRRRRRRIDDRHGQGREPVRDLSSLGFSRLCESADR